MIILNEPLKEKKFKKFFMRHKLLSEVIIIIIFNKIKRMKKTYKLFIYGGRSQALT